MPLAHFCTYPGTLAFAGALPLLAQGKVWVVDDTPGPGVDFNVLQLAVNSAADGDTVLVKAGTYTAPGGPGAQVVIDGKGLTLIAEAGALVKLVPDFLVAGLAIRNLGAAQRCVLRGLSIESIGAHALEVVDSPGSVWVEACSLQATGLFFLPDTNDAVAFVRAAASATLVRSTCRATHPTVPFASGIGSGVLAIDSTLQLYGGTCQGGGVTPCCGLGGGNCCGGAIGGDGIRLQGGFLFAAGATLLGGQGQAGCAFEFLQCCGAGGPGGSGLRLVPGAAAPEAHALQTMIVAGAGGAGGSAPFAPTCASGPSGTALVAPSGSFETLPGSARSFEMASPVRAGQSAHASYMGVAGDFVIAAYSLGFKGVWFPGFEGFLLPSYPPAVFVLGAAPSGVLALDLPFATFPAGLDVLHVYAQAFALGFGGEALLGSPSELTVLNQIF